MVSFPNHPDDLFKAFAYEQVAAVAKALSAPARLVLLNILCQGERSVELLANHAGLSTANASQHLQALKQANLVESDRRGNHVIYRVVGEDVVAFFNALKNLAIDHNSSLRQAFAQIGTSPSRLEPVGREELLQKIREGTVVVLDVRPVEEYASGHLPGAVSMPLDRLEEELGRLPESKEIVVLCRGEYCVLADRAIEILASHGLLARRSQDGVVEWKLAGLPLEGGTRDNV